MKLQLRSILAKVLQETEIESETSLNAIIGHKTDHVIDLKNEVISSPEHYVTLWTEGFRNVLAEGDEPSFKWLYDKVRSSPALKAYLDIFLRRSYLNHYEELYKKRPRVDEAEIWIGQNHADFGLLVSPRFNKRTKDWENDKSEIRHFKSGYWTIGHVLETGLVVPSKPDVMQFNSMNDYLKFFEHVLVRNTASPHQKEIAKLYVDYVKKSTDPLKVPLLIPEYRYEGRNAKHKYRLDFCVIDPNTMDKLGFELSPWSTHGNLKTVGKTQKAINEEAQSIFEKEMRKHKAFYKKHGIFALIYTDSDLTDPGAIFADISARLQSQNAAKQLSLHAIDDLFR